MAEAREECENCGRLIGKLETPCVWKERVVCEECHKRLTAAESDRDEYVPTQSRKLNPSLDEKKNPFFKGKTSGKPTAAAGVIGCMGILGLCLVLGWLFGTPSNSPSPSVSTEDKWYVGGTLHNATLYEWKAATNRNKLATAADMLVSVNKEKYKTMDLVREDAEEWVRALDEVVKGKDDEFLKHQKVSEVVAMIMVLQEHN